MLNSAVINGKVSLACDIQPASSDDQVALILWYKDDSLAPIYTVDARKVNSLEKAKITFDEQQYSSRINFNMRARPAQLQLEGVRQEDEGEYRCRVDFRRGRTVNTIISLRVIVPPSELSIIEPSTLQQYSRGQQPVKKLDGLIGPFNEGASVELTCLVSGGRPRPQIVWRRDFNVISGDSIRQQLDKEGSSVALKISSLNKSHLLSIFTCQASNNNITQPIQSSITLDLNLKPQEVVLRQLVAGPLLVGQSATFECSTSGSRPQALIYWLFQGARHDTPMNVDQQQTSSRLTLTLQRSFNQQTLTCVAENPKIPQSSGTLRQSVKLDVHYPPQLSIRLDPNGPGADSPMVTPSGTGGSASANSAGATTISVEDKNAMEAANLQEGNDIYLTCQLDVNPRPPKPILWRFNGKPLQQLQHQPAHLQQLASQQSGTTGSQQSGQIVMNNQSLVLRKVSRQQAGAYTCEAANQHGSNTSKPFELQIKHAPVCSTDDIFVYEAAVGQVVTLDCAVLANPSNAVHFSWFLATAAAAANGQSEGVAANLTNWLQQDTGLDAEQIDESSSQLKFKIKDSHSVPALIKCKAKNEIGLQQRPCLFRVQLAKVPNLQHSCQLIGAKTTSLLLHCQLNEHLKTDQNELLPPGTPHHHSRGGAEVNNSSEQQQQHSAGGGGGALGGWLNLEAIRQHQQPIGSVGLSASFNLRGGGGVEKPHARLHFPVQWLLVEIYKMPPAGLAAPDSGGGGDGGGGQLAAYIIVSTSAQLAKLKSSVEINRLFSDNPRDIYYVIARHNETDTMMPASASRVVASTAWHEFKSFPHHHHHQQQQHPVSEELQAALAGEFNFTIPQLEPDTKYKLHIYAQNLAHKSHDWLPLKAQTLAGNVPFNDSDGAPSKGGKAAKQEADDSDASLTHDEQQQQAVTGGYQNGSQMAHQKSLVMRSGGGDQQQRQQQPSSREAGEPGEEREDAAEQAGDRTGRLVDRLVQSHHNNSHLAARQQELLAQQFALYKDYAISMTKQKPLVAIPVLLLVSLASLLLIVWLSGLFVKSVRGHGGGGRLGSQLSSRTNSKQSQEISVSSKAAAAAAAAKAAESELGRPAPPFEGSVSPGNDSYDSSLASGGARNASGSGGGGGDGGGGADARSRAGSSWTDHSPPPLSSQLNESSTALLLQAADGHELDLYSSNGAGCYERQLVTAAGRVYAIETGGSSHQPLATIALEPLTGAPPDLDNHHQLSYATVASGRQESDAFQQPLNACAFHFHQQQRSVGSLDRRQLAMGHLCDEQQTINLERSSHNHHLRHHMAQHHHSTSNGGGHVGSIDRRTGPSLLAHRNQKARPMEMGYYNNQVNATNFNGSFSSTECSSQAENGTDFQQRRISSKQNHRHQRVVAFDLSNSSGVSSANARASSALATGLPHPMGGSDCLNQQQQQQQQHLKHASSGGGRTVALSDSGTSNSGQNTADSGHESPPTNSCQLSPYNLMVINGTGTTSGSSKRQHVANCPNSNGAPLQTLVNRRLKVDHQYKNLIGTTTTETVAPVAALQADAFNLSHDSSSPVSNCTGGRTNAASGGHDEDDGGAYQFDSSLTGTHHLNHHQGHHLQLIPLEGRSKMSPESQNSSTLLQSVDSFADSLVHFPSGVADSQHHHTLLMDQNHRKATSFATTTLISGKNYSLATNDTSGQGDK